MVDTEHTDDDDRSAVDHLLDYCVFAPLGFAVEARRLVPELIDRGRAQAGVARMVGEFAVRWGSTKVESVVVDAQEQAMDVLRRTGLAPTEERHRDDRPPRPTPAAPGATSPVGDRDTSAPSGAAAPGPPSAPRTPATAPGAPADGTSAPGAPPASAPDDTGPDAGGEAAALAIPDYDNLSASQVVPRLEGLTPEELEAVGRYERHHRGRKTILNKVHQLQDPDLPGA